jgi:catechol 2,3-dioxygenase-like lactoylglutathione lyase family enzyme
MSSALTLNMNPAESHYIRNLVISAPVAEELGAFYAHLLGWKVLRRDWFVIAPDMGIYPRLAFDSEGDSYLAPRWPDPERPQQIHLDIAVPSLIGAAESAFDLGASELQDNGSYRIVADPAGHPFCLYEPHDSEVVSPEITHIVLDCFSPRTVASFYEGILGMRRAIDTPEGITIARDDGRLPKLSFQQSVFVAARWPDPDYPQQVHMDIDVQDSHAAQDLALRLGASRLPAMGGSCPVFADPAAHPFCLCSIEE